MKIGGKKICAKPWKLRGKDEIRNPGTDDILESEAARARTLKMGVELKRSSWDSVGNMLIIIAP